ncbi:MAG: CD225/dispanin family protein [Muribaculaceae bacterium]|nr:CD225/dispanin family protein [Muribaculaceae bacterium]
MKYYIAENGQPAGPFELNELLEHGVTMNTQLWNETLPGWTAASNIPEVMNLLNAPLPPVPQYEQPVYEQTQQYVQPQQPQQPQYAQQQYVQPQPQPQVQYGPQPQYAQQPYQQPAGSMPMPDTHMVGAILTTLFCCLPLGIVAIIKASQVSNNYNQGNYNAAVQASNEAKKWMTWGIVGGLVVIILYVVLVVVLGVGGALASSY